MLFLKTFKDAKFTVDGSAFQHLLLCQRKNFCLMLSVHLAHSHMLILQTNYHTVMMLENGLSEVRH